MNKPFLTIFTILFLLSSYLVQAQTSRVKIGLRAGTNISRWRIKSPDPSNIGPISLPEGLRIEYSEFSQLTEALVGLDFSIPVEIRVKPFLFIQPEITFTQKGAKLTNSYTVPSLLDGQMGYRVERTKRYKYNYLHIPILAKIRYKHNKYLLDLAAGPYAGLALNGKVLIKDDITYLDGSTTIDKWDQKLSFTDLEYSRTDWGVSLGLMLGYELGKSRIFVDCRYQHGLQNITTRKTIFARYFPDRYNRGVNLSLIYQLPFLSEKD